MAFSPGDGLMPYSVTAKDGASGMGEVYRARETKLDQKVALNRSTLVPPTRLLH